MLKRRHPPFGEWSLGLLVLVFSLAFYFGMALGRHPEPIERFDAWAWHPEHSRSEPFRKPNKPEWGSGKEYPA